MFESEYIRLIRQTGVGQFLVTALVLVCTQTVYASGKTDVEGFMRAGVSFSNSKTEYMDHIDDSGSYEETLFGVALERKINSRWSAGGELSGSGTEDDYAVKIEKAFVTFRAYQEATFNIGKIAYPNLIVSEYLDEGVAYPWLRPPEEVYRADVLGPAMSYKSFSGIKANYIKGIDHFEFLFSLYGGGSTIEHDKMSRMTGAVMSVGDHRFKVRAAYNKSTLVLGTGTNRDAALDDNKQYVKSIGLNFDLKYIYGMGELLNASVEDVAELNTTAFYYTLGLRYGKFMVHYTVAEFEAENEHAQESIAYGIKYQASSFASFKMEYKLITPTERIDTDPLVNPAGHFSEVPTEKEVSIFGIVVDVTF